MGTQHLRDGDYHYKTLQGQGLGPQRGVTVLSTVVPHHTGPLCNIQIKCLGWIDNFYFFFFVIRIAEEEGHSAFVG